MSVWHALLVLTFLHSLSPSKKIPPHAYKSRDIFTPLYLGFNHPLRRVHHSLLFNIWICHCVQTVNHSPSCDDHLLNNQLPSISEGSLHLLLLLTTGPSPSEKRFFSRVLSHPHSHNLDIIVFVKDLFFCIDHDLSKDDLLPMMPALV